jgi:hypothetical protein
MSVQQSGNVTPGHLAAWGTQGVIVDWGAAPASQRVLASLRGANFNTTADQPIAIPQTVTAFQLTGIIITNSNVSPNLTAQGGFYPAASKGGSAIVAAAQSYISLTSANSLLSATLTSFANTTRFSSATLGTIGGLMQVWFSLTTAQGATASADIYLTGIDLS